MEAVRKGLAFKAFEIEELADVWFFRPAGAVIAHASSYTPITPNLLTLAGIAFGVTSGALLYTPGFGLWGFAALIVHSVLDSADGQLARLQQKFSAEGRVLDGIGGYLTNTSVFLGIGFGALRGHDGWMLAAMVAAGLCSAVHACMYDYNRNQYIAYGIKRAIPKPERIDTSTRLGRFFAFVNGDYESNQRRLALTHGRVEDDLARRFGPSGEVPEWAAAAYRRRNYWMVRGWNFLGDNTRFYAVGAVAWLGALHHYFTFILVVMNAALVLMYAAQARADRLYLEDLERGPA